MSGPGYRDDQTKPRMDLLPHDAVLGVARVLTWATTAKTPPYQERNWERGMAWSRVFNSLMRHALKLWMGEDRDLESGLPHADHVATNALMLAAYAMRPGMASFDDRPGKRPAVLDPLNPCPSCAGVDGYHRTPCEDFEVSSKKATA